MNARVYINPGNICHAFSRDERKKSRDFLHTGHRDSKDDKAISVVHLNIYRERVVRRIDAVDFFFCTEDTLTVCLCFFFFLSLTKETKKICE